MSVAGQKSSKGPRRTILAAMAVATLGISLLSATPVQAAPVAAAAPPSDDTQCWSANGQFAASDPYLFADIRLTSSQVDAAQDIADVATAKHLDDRAIRIAVAAAMQASKLDPDFRTADAFGMFARPGKRLDYSLGNPKDPATAAQEFFGRLTVQVPGYREDSRTDAEIIAVISGKEAGAGAKEFEKFAGAVTESLTSGTISDLQTRLGNLTQRLSTSPGVGADIRRAMEPLASIPWLLTGFVFPSSAAEPSAPSAQEVADDGARLLGNRFQSAPGIGTTTTGPSTSGTETSATDTRNSGTKGSDTEGSGTDGSGTDGSGTDSESDATDTESDATDTESDATDTESDATDTESDATDTETGTTDTESDATDTETGTTDTETSATETTSTAAEPTEPTTTSSAPSTTTTPTTSTEPTTSSSISTVTKTSAVTPSGGSTDASTSRPKTDEPATSAGPTSPEPAVPTTSATAKPAETSSGTNGSGSAETESPSTNRPPAETSGGRATDPDPAVPDPDEPAPSFPDEPDLGSDPVDPNSTAVPAGTPAGEVSNCLPVGGSPNQFDPGSIISDSVFYDSDSMSVAQIDRFVSAMGTACDSEWCLRNLKVTVPSYPATRYCKAYSGGPQTAAEAIAGISRACGINPQVMLVTLQKEAGLLTRSNVTQSSWNAAWGWHCPDTGPGGAANCDPQYAGFANQLHGMAEQWSRYRLDPQKYNYRAGEIADIRWNVEQSGCGSSAVYIRNTATASLYNYTPYQPNAASLSSYPGAGDECSSYGNRNFFVLFGKYFGGTGAGLPAQTAVTGTTVTLPTGANVDPAVAGRRISVPNANVARGIAAGLAAVGMPYVWGGGTNRGGADQGCSRGGGTKNSCQGVVGFDCSGLTAYVLARAGFATGTDSSSQRAGGQRISWNAAQAGDIIGYPGHVAIYLGTIDGVRYLLEAPSVGRQVQVRSVHTASADPVVYRYWR